MVLSISKLKVKLAEVAEQFAQRWSYEKAKELQDNLQDHIYSESEPEGKDFWQAHLTFLEFYSDEKGEYARLNVDISDNRKGGLFKKGSAWRPMTASLILYKNGLYEVYT